MKGDTVMTRIASRTTGDAVKSNRKYPRDASVRGSLCWTELSIDFLQTTKNEREMIVSLDISGKTNLEVCHTFKREGPQTAG